MAVHSFGRVVADCCSVDFEGMRWDVRMVGEEDGHSYPAVEVVAVGSGFRITAGSDYADSSCRSGEAEVHDRRD